MLRIGRHVSIAGSLDRAFDRADAIGCNTMQIFTSNPRQWHAEELDENRIRAFAEKRKMHRIEPVIAHMPYLPNLANHDENIYRQSVISFSEQVERCNLLGIDYLVLHLGSRLSMDKRKSMENIAYAVAAQADKMNGTILLENQAGAVNSMGSDFKELKAIRELIPNKNVGYCVDTCHAFEAGYDIRNEPILKDMDDILGIDNIKVIHLNDSKFDINAHKDRHENIGRGFIGRDGFKSVLAHYAKLGIPVILETECADEESEKQEISYVKSLLTQ